ncbi:unnamed protein product [Phytophthora fragariaefolia]|uniref:Unnamed protein product n=1 Tax=Phytophthora fragariaefolia TaxID=1490495 RepID=A0A9W7D2T8_9STRA|nr:unnamed protein product [Phytophthora fragariaefolia]
MRALATLGAAALAFVTAAVATQETAIKLDSLVALNDQSTRDGVIAEDFEAELPPTSFLYDPAGVNATDVWLAASNVLSAYGNEEDEPVEPTPQCSAGPIDVLFLVSSCYTAAQIETILTPIDCAITDGEHKFFHNDQPIEIRATYGIYYYDCHTPRVVGNFKNLKQVFYPTHQNVFVAVSKGRENSFLKVFAYTGMKVGYTLQIRTCSNRKCEVDQDDVVIASPSAMDSAMVSIRDAVFCGASPDPPTL